ALPQDVQAEAWDWPAELFAPRVWHVPRPVPEPAALARAAEVIRGASRPLIVAGGGVISAEATAELRALAEATGIPVAETPAGAGAGAAVPVGAGAGEALRALAAALAGGATGEGYRAQAGELAAAWQQTGGRAYGLGCQPPAQSEVIGAVNDAAGPRDVVVCA